MVIELPPAWILVINVAGWLGIQLGLAWIFTQMPIRWFGAAPSYAWERDGRVYERLLAIRHWKDLLPDGARWFAGGFEKAALARADPDYLHRFIRETRRGEVCHWLAILLVPVFFLWNPWWGDLIVAGYALAANLPCILTQRYNRARMLRVVERVAPCG